ncbi:MAG: helix-turn-helix domain-containing protein [Candidatus Solibacter sp.]|nr:helix-turn-helix domain-containing protein [Candidatus Solibacter sp.]
MEKLSQGPITVSRLAEPLHITLAAVVQHLRVLEESGLIQTEKVGRVRTCRLAPAWLSTRTGWSPARSPEPLAKLGGQEGSQNKSEENC